MRTIVFSHPSAKDFDALPPDVRAIIAEALNAFAIDGRGDIKKLVGAGETYRLRVGRYRVLFVQTSTEITLLYVGKRETTTYR